MTAAATFCRILPSKGIQHKQQQQPRNSRYQHHSGTAASGRRRLLCVGIPLLFLPWRGCDEGGNYSTGALHEFKCIAFYVWFYGTGDCRTMPMPLAVRRRGGTLPDGVPARSGRREAVSGSAGPGMHSVRL